MQNDIFDGNMLLYNLHFHILKVKAETGATERRREAVTKTSEEDHDREKVKNRKKVIVYEAYPKTEKRSLTIHVK